jgi:hypothetical protein
LDDLDEVITLDVIRQDPAEEGAAPRRRWRRWLVGGAVALLLGLPAAWFGARTEPICGPLLDDILGELSAQAGVTVRRGEIAPWGWSGLEVRALELRRRGESERWLKVASVRAQPDLGALWDGELRLTEVTLSGVEGELRLARGEGGDLALARGLTGGARGGGDGEAAGGSSGRRAGLWSRLPAVTVEDARITVRDLDGRFEALTLESQRLALTRRVEGAQTVFAAAGDVAVGGYDRGELKAEATLPGGVASATLDWGARQDLSAAVQRHVSHDLLATARVWARGVTVSWPPSATLRGLEVEGLDVEIPWAVDPAAEGAASARPRIGALSVGSVRGEVSEATARFSTTDARVGVRLPGAAGLHEVPLGHAQVEVDPVKEELRLSTELQGALGLGSVHASWGTVTRALELTLRVSEVPWGPYAPLVPSAARRHVDLRQGRLSGTLVLDWKVEEGLADLHSDLTLREGAVLAPIFAREPLEGVALVLKADVGVDAPCRCVWLRGGQVALGALRAEAEGHVFALDGGWDVSLHLTVPRQSAQAALDALPRGLAPALEGYALEGDFQAHLRLDVDTRRAQALRLDAQIDDAAVKVARGGHAVDFGALKGGFRMVARGLPDAREVGDLAPGWTPWSEIPAWVPQAITCAEDGGFWEHEGFDLRGIHRALVANIEQGRIARGGSSISQQVVKNLFLHHDRTLGRKLQEAFLTWHMEQVLSKERILEIYLNMLHLGPGIYGLREASRRLFEKIPARLSLREAVFLGSILPNPDYFIRRYAAGEIPEDRRSKMRNILANMEATGYIGPRVHAQAVRLTDQAVISIASPPRHLPAPGVSAEADDPADEADAASFLE